MDVITIINNKKITINYNTKNSNTNSQHSTAQHNTCKYKLCNHNNPNTNSSSKQHTSTTSNSELSNHIPNINFASPFRRLLVVWQVVPSVWASGHLAQWEDVELGFT